MSEDIKEVDERVARLVVGVGRNAVTKMAEGLYTMVKFEHEPEKGLQLLSDASTEDKVAYFQKATNIFSEAVNELAKVDSDEAGDSNQ